MEKRLNSVREHKTVRHLNSATLSGRVNALSRRVSDQASLSKGPFTLRPELGPRSARSARSARAGRGLVHLQSAIGITYTCSCMLVNHGPSQQSFQRRLQAMEMRCYRKILRISYKDHVTNKEVRAKIPQAIGPHEDLTTQTAVVWTCLPFIRFGQNHLARHSERGEDDKADRGRGGKTISGNGQDWSSLSPKGL